MEKNGRTAPVAVERITRAILILRGHKVLLDVELAALYGVPTKALNQAVKRNVARFPEDFMFRLSRAETVVLKPVTTCDRFSTAPRPAQTR